MYFKQQFRVVKVLKADLPRLGNVSFDKFVAHRFQGKEANNHDHWL